MVAVWSDIKGAMNDCSTTYLALLEGRMRYLNGLCQMNSHS